MKNRVKKLISNQFGIELKDIKDSSNLVSDLGLDSLDAIELIMACEEEFSIEISDDEVEKIETFEDIITFLKTKNV